MHIYEVIEKGLAAADRSRVEIVDLEPVEVATESVVGLTAIVSQLAYNATQLLSEEGDKVHISGALEQNGYSLLIIDHGMGMSDEFLEGLNRILAYPGDSGDGAATSGVQLVAGLVARHGIGVRLEHGDPGVTARVSIPSRLLEDRTPVSVDSLGASPEEPAIASEPKLVAVGSKPLEMDTEAFLESIFGPLQDAAVAPVAEPKVVAMGAATEVTSLVTPPVPEPTEPLHGHRRATLQTRVPGRNYDESDPAPSHTKPGEAAVDIKLALANYTRGREAADGSGDYQN